MGFAYPLESIVSLLVNFGFCNTFLQELIQPCALFSSPSRTLITQILGLLLQFCRSLRLSSLFFSLLFSLYHLHWVISIVLFHVSLILSSPLHYAVEIIHCLALVIIFFSFKISIWFLFIALFFCETLYFFDKAFYFLICFKHVYNG